MAPPTTKTHTRRPLAWVGALVFSLAALLLLSSPLSAKPRKDMDGKRIRARQIPLNALQKDSLSPPADPRDWRYVKIESKGTLSVQTQAKNAHTLRIVDGQGKEVGQKQGKDGKCNLSIKVIPGIYYVEVGSEGALSYTIKATQK